MQKNRGFTLIEMMVTIVILAIIATMAVPSFGKMIARKKFDSTTRNLALLLGEARGQAIVLRKNITIKLSCPTETDGSGNSKVVCPPNTPTTFSWVSPRDNVELTSDAIDVVYSGIGFAKQRTKMIDNPSFDSSQPEDLTTTPPTNPKKIEKQVGLVFVLYNSELGASQVICVSKIGIVDKIEKIDASISTDAAELKCKNG